MALGFLFNLNYVIGALGFNISFYSVIFVLILSVLILLSRFKVYRYDVAVCNLVFVSVFCVLLSYLDSNLNGNASYKVVIYIVKILPLLLIPVFLKDNIVTFFEGYLYSLLLSVVILFIQSMQVDAVSVNNRFEIGGLNPIWISRIAFELLLLLIAFGKRNLFFVVFIPVVYISYLSGSKGPLLAFFITVAMYYLNYIKINKYYIFIIVVLLAPLSYYFVQSISQDSYIYNRFIMVAPDDIMSEHYESSRVVLWPSTIELILNSEISNILFGNGFGNFGNVYFESDAYDGRKYPHNILLEIVVEIGILFLLVFMVAILYSLKRNTVFSYLMLYYFLNANFSGDLLLNDRLFLYLITSLVVFSGYYKSSRRLNQI
jgi:hypothetical protein